MERRKLFSFASMAFQNWISLDRNFQGLFSITITMGFREVENKSRNDLPIKISALKNRLDCVFIKLYNFGFKLVIN